MKQTLLYTAVATLLLQGAYAQETQQTEAEQTLDDIQVIAKISDQPNVQVINPKEAIQPVPAQDGAELLKLIPNMSIARKGGGGGEPVFRGLGGSRLRILSNDHMILGGCGGRMDPPTAYIYPESYDEVIFIKGPQTVLYGPGNIAGVARFVRNDRKFDEFTTQFSGSLLGGSFDRLESYADAIIGTTWGWVHANATYNKSNNYKDGAGNKVHSKYKRESQTLELGLTPTENTLIELGYDRSRGHTYYADRMMDGVKFDRDSWRIKVKQENLTEWLTKVQFEYSHNKIDHVMDNYSFREVIGKGKHNMKMYAVSNPARTTQTAKLFAELAFGDTHTVVGMDWFADRHKLRMTGMKPALGMAQNYVNMPYQLNQKFKNIGVFAETTWYINDDNKLVAGYRHDRNDAKYNPNFGMGAKLPANLHNQRYNLDSAFIRYEHAINDWTLHAGYGMAQRAPDFWERSRGNGALLSKETNHELDFGVLYQTDELAFTTTAFISHISDYILIDQGNARNISADRYGAEAQVQWNFAPNWTLSSSLAYTHGKNKTDGKALAQIAPLEWTTDLNWSNEQFSAGAVWRVVDSQNRFAKGQGNIFGADSGPSAGFGVVSLNAGWKIRKEVTLLAGVDNVFNKNYSEFVSRSAQDTLTYQPQNFRVNEPGRRAWLRLNVNF